MAKKAKTQSKQAANLGFEAKLWLSAEKLRNNMDAAEHEGEIRRAIMEAESLKPIWSIAWWRCPASYFTARRSRSACGF